MSQKFNTELSWLRFEKVLLKLTAENRLLKREHAQYLRWLKVLANPMSVATRIRVWAEMRRMMPGLFAGGGKGK